MKFIRDGANHLSAWTRLEMGTNGTKERRHINQVADLPTLAMEKVVRDRLTHVSQKKEGYLTKCKYIRAGAPPAPPSTDNDKGKCISHVRGTPLGERVRRRRRLTASRHTHSVLGAHLHIVGRPIVNKHFVPSLDLSRRLNQESTR